LDKSGVFVTNSTIANKYVPSRDSSSKAESQEGYATRQTLYGFSETSFDLNPNLSRFISNTLCLKI
jgi:hypothetical protein